MPYLAGARPRTRISIQWRQRRRRDARSSAPATARLSTTPASAERYSARRCHRQLGGLCDLVIGREASHDPAADEPRELVERADRAVRCGGSGSTFPTAPTTPSASSRGSSSRIAAVGEPSRISVAVSPTCWSVPWRSTSVSCCSSTSRRLEEVSVLGHELDRRLGALADAARAAARRGSIASALVRRSRSRMSLGQLAEQRLLVLEVPVEEALGHAGGADDVDDARLGVAALGEQRARRSRAAAACARGPGR